VLAGDERRMETRVLLCRSLLSKGTAPSGAFGARGSPAIPIFRGNQFEALRGLVFSIHSTMYQIVRSVLLNNSKTNTTVSRRASQEIGTPLFSVDG